MYQIVTKISHHYRLLFSALATLMFLGAIFAMSHQAFAAGTVKTSSEHIITLHDDGIDKGFITKKATVREALKEQRIRLDARDRTEPGLDEKLISSSYQVNIYRARPVLIRDGSAETKIVTSFRTPKQIAKDANVTIHDEDVVRLLPSSDPLVDGASEIMTITRATPFTFDFYGKQQQAYTMASTVEAMLREKGIVMASSDDISPVRTTQLQSGMTIRLWRNGIQTLTVDEEIAFTTKQITNADQPVGYQKVETPGERGKRTVTYEINMQNGIEVARKEINAVTTKQPSEQVEIVGTKPNGNGLTKAKGVMMFTDSRGITHRETYYDLNMKGVMQIAARECGVSPVYTVRADGAKVDLDGYVIVAAHLGNYPRCSVVETSIGAGKVYDTGDFATRHPHGFDLATDWTKADGI